MKKDLKRQAAFDEIIYYDCTACKEAVSVISDHRALQPAGTTVYSMPDREKNAVYCRIREAYDIAFLFDSMDVKVSFYAVPRFDIMAVDSRGGYIGMLGSICDLEEDRPVYYIDAERRTFKIAESGPAFVRNMSHWREARTLTKDFRLFDSRAEAERYYSIIDLRDEMESLQKRF